MSTSSSSGGEIDRKKPFEATPTQREFIDCTKKQVLLSGAFGAGKSRVGCEKGMLLNLKYPGNRGLIVREQFTDVRASTIETTLLEEVLPESHIASHNQTKHKIEHFTGHRDENDAPILSEIHYHGLDSGRSKTDDDLPTKIGGQQYGWIFVDEGIEISQGAWIQLMGRLRYTGKEQAGKLYRVPFRQIFTATNPSSKMHWMYNWFFDPDDDKKEQRQWYRMTAHELQNHVSSIPDDYVDMMENNFPGIYYDRYVKGEWVAAEGLVYNEFNPKTHVLPADELPDSPVPENPENENIRRNWVVDDVVHWDDEHTSVYARPPEDWRVYMSIDFGYGNPFVCQWWAWDEMRDIHVMFREYYKTEELPQDIGPELNENSDALTIEQRFSDPSEPGDRETLSKHGVPTKKADNDISAGIKEVKSKMSQKVDGFPKVIIMEDALIHKPDRNLLDDTRPERTLNELGEYQWNDDKEKPEKEDDHGMDAMRYYFYSKSRGSSWSKDEMQRMEELFNSGEGF